VPYLAVCCTIIVVFRGSWVPVC